LTDVHEREQVAAVAQVVDVLQTPAFLARQTDFIAAVAASGKPVNIKKGQFMAPGDMKHVVDKARSAAAQAGCDPDSFMLCDRGVSFGYNTLVSDMRGLAIMAETGCPVVFDATHSVQQPGGLGERSADSANTSRCSQGPPWRRELQACSWKPIRIRTMPFPMVPMPCRLSSSNPWWNA